MKYLSVVNYFVVVIYNKVEMNPCNLQIQLRTFQNETGRMNVGSTSSYASLVNNPSHTQESHATKEI